MWILQVSESLFAFFLKSFSSSFSKIFLLISFPQSWHGDAAALLPAGAPGGHHGADRQHLGWEPLQVLAVTLLGTPAMMPSSDQVHWLPTNFGRLQEVWL